MGSTHDNVMAETPFFGTIISHAASNHTVHGVVVSWKIIPAVTDTRRQHSRPRLRPSLPRPLRVPPHCEHTNPSGQRNQSTRARHLGSSRWCGQESEKGSVQSSHSTIRRGRTRGLE